MYKKIILEKGKYKIDLSKIYKDYNEAENDLNKIDYLIDKINKDDKSDKLFLNANNILNKSMKYMFLMEMLNLDQRENIIFNNRKLYKIYLDKKYKLNNISNLNNDKDEQIEKIINKYYRKINIYKINDLKRKMKNTKVLIENIINTENIELKEKYIKNDSVIYELNTNNKTKEDMLNKYYELKLDNFGEYYKELASEIIEAYYILFNLFKILEKKQIYDKLPYGKYYKELDIIINNINGFKNVKKKIDEDFLNKNNLKNTYFNLYTVDFEKRSSKFDYDKSIEIILNSFDMIGDSYKKEVLKTIKDGRIDLIKRKNKINKNFVYEDYLSIGKSLKGKGIYSLAHELGHLIENIINGNYNSEIFNEKNIELFALINEYILNDYLLKINIDYDFKRIIVNKIFEMKQSLEITYKIFEYFEKIGIDNYEKLNSEKQKIIEDIEKYYLEIVKKDNLENMSAPDCINKLWTFNLNLNIPFSELTYIMEYVFSNIIFNDIKNKKINEKDYFTIMKNNDEIFNEYGYNFDDKFKLENNFKKFFNNINKN